MEPGPNLTVVRVQMEKIETNILIPNYSQRNHRIARVGKDLKDHPVQQQPNHTTLTLTALR